MAVELQFLKTRERFLPIKRKTLQDRMLGDSRLSAREREQFGELFEMIGARFHFEFHSKLEHLRALYDPVDPDCETAAYSPLAVSGKSASPCDEFFRVFGELLAEANYVEMSREHIMACAEHQSRTGLLVRANLSDYAQLRVFYRGIRDQSRTLRRWLRPWRKKTETVHVMSRVAMVVRLVKDPRGCVFLKFFKDVVAEDLEMLLPHVGIRMRLLDHLKIGSSVVGGLATAVWKVFTATILSPWLFLLVLFGFSGAAIRGVFGFFSSKTKYLQVLSSNLYFRNLANNGCVLAHLVDSAEVEECKELVLAYFILYVERDRDFTVEELDRRVESWLRAESGLDTDFDVSDAVRKLVDKDILVRRCVRASESGAGEEVLKVYDLPSTLRRLDATWDAYFRHDCSQRAEDDCLADGPRPARLDDGSEHGAEGVEGIRRIDAVDTSSSVSGSHSRPENRRKSVTRRMP